MSEFQVEVVRIGAIEKHPNADSLSITQVFGGYPVIIRTGDFSDGSLAVYVPVDSVVPTDREPFKFLDGHPRVRAKRLRGIFSMGLLVPANPSWVEGQNVAAELGVTKYVPPEEREHRPGQPHQRKRPQSWDFPVYTDIEGLRKHKRVLEDGEEVAITCKLHGSNMRAVYWLDNGEPWWHRWLRKIGIGKPPMRLWIGSHNCLMADDSGSEWTKLAHSLDLETKLKRHPGIVLFGESLGCFSSSGFSYDSGGKSGGSFRAFDAMDLRSRKYLDYDQFLSLCSDIGVCTVPLLYRGPWSLDKAFELAEGPDPINPKHCREGIVIKPTKERWNARLGRVILKLHGEGFLLRKEKKEAA